MPQYACIIQEGQVVERRQEALAEGLRRIGRDAFGDDPAACETAWIVVKRDFGWTAGEPSTSSLVVRSVPVGLPPRRDSHAALPMLRRPRPHHRSAACPDRQGGR